MPDTSTHDPDPTAAAGLARDLEGDPLARYQATVWEPTRQALRDPEPSRALGAARLVEWFLAATRAKPGSLRGPLAQGIAHAFASADALHHRAAKLAEDPATAFIVLALDAETGAITLLPAASDGRLPALMLPLAVWDARPPETEKPLTRKRWFAALWASTDWEIAQRRLDRWRRLLDAPSPPPTEGPPVSE